MLVITSNPTLYSCQPRTYADSCSVIARSSLLGIDDKKRWVFSKKHHWSSGRIHRCHRWGPCSIHGWCSLNFFLACNSLGMRGAWRDESHYFDVAIELLVKSAFHAAMRMIQPLPNFQGRFNTSPDCANLYLRVLARACLSLNCIPFQTIGFTYCSRKYDLYTLSIAEVGNDVHPASRFCCTGDRAASTDIEPTCTFSEHTHSDR
jgi:hypothetical protein